MKTTRLTFTLRIAAAAILISALGTWLATGRHLGWTQTSVVTVQHDEVTGIEYPVRQPAFVAGVEVLALGAATAALLGGLSYFVQRRRAVTA